MAITLKFYCNEDDALLYWTIPTPIKGCRGFAIERKRTTALHGAPSQSYLQNRMGFENESVGAKPKEGQKAVTKPSNEWPFQRFSWTDHEVNTGDTVSYRIVPVVRAANGTLQTAEADASAWSPARTLGGKSDSRFQAFFNRGFVMSQFMARYLAEQKLTLAKFKAVINDEHDQTIRTFLSGDLRLKLLEQLDLSKTQKTDVYAALFELSDPDLIPPLCALGKKAHVVLANGSITKKKTETTEQARQRDENEKARKQLVKAKVDVQTTNRFTSPGPLGHNKFLVRMDANGKPRYTWTGSTNWTPTGLCTQINNGLLIDDASIAKAYFEQWQRLRDAKSDFPPSLVTANSSAKQIAAINGASASIWFSRTQRGVDLEALRAEVAKAKQGILFLMFMPGATGLFADVDKRSQEPGLYVRGVVSELPHGRGDESQADVSLISDSTRRSLHLDIIQPEGVRHAMARFAEEVTRKQFLSQIGHAIIHSKVLCIDPFSDNPAVITGSHNFSTSASGKNDENFIIIRGDKALAEAYAVNILSAYQHYRWRAYLAETNKPFNGLKDSDAWQAPMLASQSADIRFWTGS